MALSSALETHLQNYEGMVTLPIASLKELKWWDTMYKENGKILLKSEMNIIIDSNALLQGWGAFCGMHGHINCLELLAATLAVQSFAKNKSRLHILLRINNITAVGYMGITCQGS